MMKKLTIPVAAMLVLLVSAEGFSGWRAKQRRACRRAARCMPCRVVCQQPSCGSTGTCKCPYFDFGDFWYGEEFAIETQCDDGIPVAVFDAISMQTCEPPMCGCFGRTANELLPLIECDNFWQGRCLGYREDIDLTGQPDVHKLGGPFHLHIETIEGTGPPRKITISYFHLMVRDPLLPPEEQQIPFWVGFECEPGPAPRPGHATQEIPGCNAILRIPPGGMGNGHNSKTMIVNITKNGCAQ